MDRIHIYDPNASNPYGRELANVLRTVGCEPVLWTSQHASGDAFERHEQLARSRQSTMLFAFLARRLVEPLRVVVPTLFRGERLVVVWTRDAWDATVFWIVSVLRTDGVFVIDHNPTPDRARSGLSGWAFRRLCRKAIVLVHSARLALAAEQRSARVRQVEHPPYALTVRDSLDGAFEPGWPEVGVRVAYVGAARPDKGSGDLPEVARGIRDLLPKVSIEFVLLGPGNFDGAVEEGLRQHNCRVRYVESESGMVSDEQIVRGLRESDVMVAPYQSVTESGSVLLALDCGAPVFAYRSPAFESRLEVERQFESGFSLGLGVARFVLSRPRQMQTNEVARLGAAQVSWSTALEFQ